MAFHTPSHRIERVGSGRMGSGVRRLLSFPFTVMMRCIVTKIVQSMYGVGVSGGRGLIQCDPSFSDVSTFVGAERVRNVPSTLSRFSTFGFLALTAHHGSPTRESPPRPATLISAVLNTSQPPSLPAGLFHAGQVARERLQPEVVLWTNMSANRSPSTSLPSPPPPPPHTPREEHGMAGQRTLDILKSLKIPRPLPPRMHLFLIWVGRV